MEYCLNNEKLCVRVAAEGAQLQSVRGADGTEYLCSAIALNYR